jgi:hypothetical protein
LVAAGAGPSFSGITVPVMDEPPRRAFGDASFKRLFES